LLSDLTVEKQKEYDLSVDLGDLPSQIVDNRNALSDSEDIISSPPSCSENGEVCIYHGICFDLNSKEWEVKTGTKNASVFEFDPPLLNNFGLNNLQILSSNSSHFQYSSCNERFGPLKEINEEHHISEKDAIVTKGTTYFMCCWYPQHFGHILMNMILPSFNAFSKIGLGGDEISSMKFIIDPKTERSFPLVISSMVDFITGGLPDRVLSFPALTRKAKEEGKKRLCFERLIVGMPNDSLIGVGVGDDPTTAKHEIGMLQPMKDELRRLYPFNMEDVNLALKETLVPSMSRLVPDRLPGCSITLLVRLGIDSRHIENQNETVGVINKVFDPNIWSLQTVTFDNASIKSQYFTIQNTNLFISVTGTGSHLAMFLPDGGASLEISFWNGHINNRKLCSVIPALLCYAAPNIPKYQTLVKAKRGSVMVDLEKFREKLLIVHEQLHERCTTSRGKFKSK